MKRAPTTAPTSNEAGLAGSMISRTARRVIDQRFEARYAGLVDDAVLTARGAEKLVRVINISGEGAMITPSLKLRIGEEVALRLAGDLHVDGNINWIREGRMGINFTTPLEITA